MNNVYIGARYVPKFDGDYDPTKTYEPLTVINWNDGSYTSKRTVPAGTLPSVTDYWALTGNYNGQIAYLQNQIDDLNEAVENISAQKNVILVGDSYALGIGGNGTTIESELEALHPWTVTTFAEGGCGYIRYNDQNHRAYDVLQAGLAAMTSTEKNDITNVVLCCSVYNELGAIAEPTFNQNGFTQALTQISNLVKSQLPNANITVIPSLWIDVTYNTSFIRVFEWTKAAAQAIGAGYPDNSINWLMPYGSSVNSGDDVHPSAYGYTIIANHIATVLNGSEPAMYSGIDVITTATGDPLTIKYHKNYASIYGLITKEEGQTFTSLFDVPLPLQKLNNYPIYINKYGTSDVMCMLITHANTFCASDWFDTGSTYILNCIVPYENFI